MTRWGGGGIAAVLACLCGFSTFSPAQAGKMLCQQRGPIDLTGLS
jgi:hypothetical protein